LLNRGFIVAYPHIRGCKDLSETWFEKGSGIQRLTSVTDLLDTANVRTRIEKYLFKENLSIC